MTPETNRAAAPGLVLAAALIIPFAILSAGTAPAYAAMRSYSAELITVDLGPRGMLLRDIDRRGFNDRKDLLV
ncbi:MAG: hypothetical protein FJX64_02675 [Alphaproteobacteria bacterium]|nr:hypothetical protein [Alphaproteobacteria bacterium]